MTYLMTGVTALTVASVVIYIRQYYVNFTLL